MGRPVRGHLKSATTGFSRATCLSWDFLGGTARFALRSPTPISVPLKVIEGHIGAILGSMLGSDVVQRCSYGPQVWALVFFAGI